MPIIQSISELDLINGYDYIVVGSGSAGSIVAGRLSENPSISVLLLEAGGDSSEVADVWDPNQINCLYNDTSIHWGYMMTPQANMNNRVMNCWRAKMTGGCTSHNDMVYTRGAPADFNDWENNYGCAGWDYAGVETAFGRVEGMLQPTITVQNSWSTSFLDACEAAGIPYNPDYNSGANMLGVSPLQSTITAGNVRQTSYNAYIAPYLDQRTNLMVVTSVVAKNILFNSENSATGLHVQIDNDTLFVPVSKEILLCAGAINSPQILMRSGIGSATDLKQLGIQSVVSDLPGVGANLQDAMIFIGHWSTAQPIYNQPRNEGYAMVWANMNSDEQPFTCLEMMRGQYTCGQTEEQLESFYSISGGMMRLESKGSVTLSSLDLNAKPIINPNLLSAPNDLEQGLIAFSLMREIGNSPSLAQWRKEETSPGPSVQSESEIREWLLNNSFTYSHPVGTCKMGTTENSVVNSELQVYGVQGVRVIDASVMPRITSGHTQGPAFMIGEMGSAMINEGN